MDAAGRDEEDTPAEASDRLPRPPEWAPQVTPVAGADPEWVATGQRY